MKHKTLSLYVPCLDGGCEDAGRIELGGYTLISDERLCDLEAAEDAITEAYWRGYETGQEEIEKERDELRAELAQLHKEADKFGDGIDWIQRALQAEAHIAEMEKQEPVATIHINSITGNPSVDFIPGHCYLHHNSSLYALPGAQGEGK